MSWKEAETRTSLRPKVQPQEVAINRRDFAHGARGVSVYLGETVARKLRFTKDNLLMVKWGLDEHLGRLKIELTDNKRVGARLRRHRMFPVYAIHTARIPEVYTLEGLNLTNCTYEVYQNMIEGGVNLSVLLVHLPKIMIAADPMPPRRVAAR